jgi:antitoxin (DNA-binding transcriptional repressor) of toxin-antitoxin stability system
MTTMGFYEARTHLSELLDQVAKGKKFSSPDAANPPPCLVPLPRRTSTMCARSSRRCWHSAIAKGLRYAAN